MMLLAVSLHPQWLPVVGAGCGCVGATHSLDDAPGASSERQRLQVMQRQCLANRWVVLRRSDDELWRQY